MPHFDATHPERLFPSVRYYCSRCRSIDR